MNKELRYYIDFYAMMIMSTPLLMWLAWLIITAWLLVPYIPEQTPPLVQRQCTQYEWRTP